MKHKVLILSASAGTGHVRSGDALARAFEESPEVAAVRHFDALVFTNKLFRDFYSKLYAQLVAKAPHFLGWWYKQTDEPWRTDRMRLMLDRLNTRKLVSFIRKFEPDICLCTHFMPAGIISYLMEKEALPAHLSIVVTDYDFHAMWLSRNFHRYFVATGEIKAYLTELGFPPDRITVSGIPIDPAFAHIPARDALRREMRLDLDRKMVLFNTSGVAAEDVDMIIDGLSRISVPLQAVVLCGRSEENKERIVTRVAALPDPGRFRLVGYTSRMQDWMGAADLYVGKPGGLTTSEALAIGLPLVIVSPIPGQEERNSDFLLENGAAIKCHNPVTFHHKVEKLLTTPALLDKMASQARALGCPLAAQTVVDTLLQDSRGGLPPVTVADMPTPTS